MLTIGQHRCYDRFCHHHQLYVIVTAVLVIGCCYYLVFAALFRSHQPNKAARMSSFSLSVQGRKRAQGRQGALSRLPQVQRQGPPSQGYVQGFLGLLSRPRRPGPPPRQALPWLGRQPARQTTPRACKDRTGLAVHKFVPDKVLPLVNGSLPTWWDVVPQHRSMLGWVLELVL